MMSDSSDSLCLWFVEGAVGVASPSLYVCAVVRMRCYPTDCVCIALIAFLVVQCVPPAVLSCILNGVVGR